MNRSSQRVGVTSKLSPQSSPNFVSTVATRGLAGQQIDLRQGFVRLEEQASETGTLGVNTQPIGVLQEQGLDNGLPEGMINLEEGGENAELTIDENLLQQFNLEAEVTPAS